MNTKTKITFLVMSLTSLLSATALLYRTGEWNRSGKSSSIVGLKKIQGDWVLRKVSVLAPAGVNYAEFSGEEVAGGMRIVGSPVNATVARPGEEYATVEADFRIGDKRIRATYEIVIRPSSVPSEIDGVEAGMENKGIYKLSGRMLTKCSTTNINHERPKSFSDHPINSQILTSWERSDLSTQ